MTIMVESRDQARRAGFTLVEVIVALLILTVGVLGLAGTTAFVVRQVTGARVATERSQALSSAIEQVRSIDYSSLSGSGLDSVGRFETTWTVDDYGSSKLVTFVTVGPGLETTTGNMTALRSGVIDTFTYRIVRP